MAKEIMMTGKTTEEAVEKAIAALGVSKEQCRIEVLEEAKSKFFGLIKAEARVKVTVKEAPAKPAAKPAAKAAAKPVEKAEAAPAVEAKPAQKKPFTGERNPKLTAAIDYLREILDNMELQEFTIDVEEQEESATLTIQGDKKKLGILIGRHGETLDALQYLVFLACTRVEGSYYRITLDCGNYRETREESLKELAARTAAKVKKNGRSQMLEPMNAYERRIIHAELSNVEGVISKSKGDEPNRRVVVIPTNKNGQPLNNRRGGSNGGYNRGNRSGGYRKPRRAEKTMEEILKEDRAGKAMDTAAPAASEKISFSEEEKNTKLYSKIEL